MQWAGYRCGGSQGLLQICKDSVKKEMKNLSPGHCQFWVSNAVTVLGSKPKCSFKAWVCSMPQNAHRVVPAKPRRLGAQAQAGPPRRGSQPLPALKTLSSRVTGGEIGELGPFLLNRAAARLAGSCPGGTGWPGPPVLGKRPEDGGSAPTARGWPPPQQSAGPAAQTASLPLNLSPRRRPPQETRWHVNIMKLKTCATQSYISFHVLNI